MNKTAALAILVATTATATPAPTNVWEAYKNFADMGQVGNGMRAAVGFMPETHCDRAALIVAGNGDIGRIAMIIDDTTFGLSVVDYKEPGVVALVLTDSALRAMKHGHWGALVTDQGVLFLSLSGSSNALESAYAECETMAASGSAQANGIRPLLATDPADVRF